MIVEEGAPHLTVAKFIITLALIFVSAKALGALFQRVKLPSVLGELIAGIILGGSMLAIVPTSETQVGYETFHIFAEIGLILLLFEIGLETKLGDLVKVGPQSTLVAIVGIVAPFCLGFFSIFAFQKVGLIDFNENLTTLIAIATGATLCATSVGITARVLSDMEKLHTKEAQIVIGAAVVDDIIGLIILSVVSGLIESFQSGAGGGVSVLSISISVVKAFGFLAAAIIIGNFISTWAFNFVERLNVRGVISILAVAFAFLYAYAASLVGLAPIVGAFAAGLVLRKTNQFNFIEDNLRPVSDFFTPIFFVVVGAEVDVRAFNPFAPDGVNIISIAMVLFVLAMIGKYVSGFAVRDKSISSNVIGLGMIPRGEVGLIFAQVGLDYGIFDLKFFSAVTVMVILTTFIAPPLLQISFGKDGPEEEGAEKDDYD